MLSLKGEGHWTWKFYKFWTQDQRQGTPSRQFGIWGFCLLWTQEQQLEQDTIFTPPQKYGTLELLSVLDSVTKVGTWTYPSPPPPPPKNMEIWGFVSFRLRNKSWTKWCKDTCPNKMWKMWTKVGTNPPPPKIKYKRIGIAWGPFWAPTGDASFSIIFKKISSLTSFSIIIIF